MRFEAPLEVLHDVLYIEFMLRIFVIMDRTITQGFCKREHTICILSAESRCQVLYPFYVCRTPSPPTKSLGFGGFDSSKHLSLNGGNSHVRGIL